MSLSDDAKAGGPRWGTVFSMGREHSLGGIERGRSTAWTEADEAAYLERVRDKAARMAAEMLDAARAEAGALREQARQEGYNQGIDEARAELEAFRAGMADSVSAVLSAIEGQCSHIFGQWRSDLVGVARLAVEKITAIELSTERAAILEALLTESVGILEKRRDLVIRVNPEDEPVITDIVALTREKFPDVQAWRVRADAGISPGGMVVESEYSLAEGRVESRRIAVDEVLSHLTLPGTP